MWLTQSEVVFIFLRAKISDEMCNVPLNGLKNEIKHTILIEKY